MGAAKGEVATAARCSRKAGAGRGQRAILDCGGKRSATPLCGRTPLAIESAVVAALCRRTPQSVGGLHFLTLAAGTGPPYGLLMPATLRSFAALLKLAVILLAMPTPVSAADAMLKLHLRSRTATTRGDVRIFEKTVSWNPRHTALIVCDMWDDHWCKSAARRVAEMAGPLNGVVEQARARGVFIIHAPSSVTDFYKDTPQRRRARAAPFAKTPVPLATAERWGTAWCWTDPRREKVLPIDDSDMGCSCVGAKCPIEPPWKRQIATLELHPEDALTDHGQETWNLLRERGITNVILCGVHLNMCVLGRPFAIRQQVYLGMNVALMRDMTDTMYNPERPPGVDHFTGTDLVIAHVERHWCPSFTSTDLTGKPAFRFQEDKR
jgi:nicotinamidase-related amidase